MLKRRIFFSIWCLIVLLYLFLHADIVSVMLFTLTLMITVATAVCAYITAKKMSVSISGDKEAIDSATVNLEISSNSILPVFNGLALLKYKNTNEENEQSLNVNFYLGIKEKCSIELELKSDNETEISVILEDVRIMDIFGIISFIIIPERNKELTIVVRKQEDAVDEQGFVSDSKETKTEHEEENSTEQVQK